MEIWKPIDDFDGYEVSNLGRVRSCKRGKWKILKPDIVNGYQHVVLYHNDKRKQCTVHRLVAEVFIDNPMNKPEVNHIDGNKQNNCAFNLEWCTRSENTQHAYDTGLQAQGEKHPAAKFTNEQIGYIREHYIPNDREFGQVALAEMFGVEHSTIRCIVRGETYASVGGKIADRFEKCKLTPAQARYVRSHYKPYDKEFGQRALAEMFGVKQQTIGDIVNGKTYKNAGGNIADKYEKRKLTPAQIREIRQMYVKGSHDFGQVALAEKFGVSQRAIWNIISGKSYKDIE